MDMPSVEEAQKVVGKRKYFLNSGCSRNVFYKPGSRWVYKQNKHYNDSDINELEFRTYMSRKDKLPEGVKLPEMHLLPNGVIAAEFIEGEHPTSECYPGYHWCKPNERSECFWEIYGDRLNNILSDSGSHNVMVTPDGTVYIIDLGESDSW